ncbi:MAG: DNA/RNA non-specific endonuclease, partial [Bacteroidaceae bacterium]|nr:DNA/RNA non-specific endonuclease [Bacteroidaceae bacterium]
DYRGSGYDRGHMCPSADCKHTRQSQNDCFLLSNMCPQLHALNAGDWEQLERRCRQWATEYDSIFIVCGPILEKDVTYKRVGENGVTVPEQFYKVVLRLTKDGAEAIGFIMNNSDETHPLPYYAVTVDSVERRTGINFFSKLERRAERRAEAACDVTKWKYLK